MKSLIYHDSKRNFAQLIFKNLFLSNVMWLLW